MRLVSLFRGIPSTVSRFRKLRRDAAATCPLAPCRSPPVSDRLPWNANLTSNFSGRQAEAEELLPAIELRSWMHVLIMGNADDGVEPSLDSASAGVVELGYTPVLGTGARKSLRVRVPPPAHIWFPTRRHLGPRINAKEARPAEITDVSKRRHRGMHQSRLWSVPT